MATALALSAVGVCANSAQADDQVLQWGLVGVAADQRTVVVASTDPALVCSSEAPKLELAKETTRSVVLQLRLSGGYETPCEQPASTFPTEPFLLKLPHKLKGQAIRGLRNPIEVDARWWSVWNMGTGAPKAEHREWSTPSTVGLSVEDAIALFRAVGVPRRRISIDGPRKGWVQTQAPVRQKAIDPSQDRVTLRTARKSWAR